MKRVCFGRFVHVLCFSVILTTPELLTAAEESEREMWWSIIANWFPMLLLIGVWIYFMKNMKTNKGWGQFEETNRHLEKIEQTLERIAKAIEKK